jgi:hypothetical protein
MDHESSLWNQQKAGRSCCSEKVNNERRSWAFDWREPTQPDWGSQINRNIANLFFRSYVLTHTIFQVEAFKEGIAINRGIKKLFVETLGVIMGPNWTLSM